MFNMNWFLLIFVLKLLTVILAAPIDVVDNNNAVSTDFEILENIIRQGFLVDEKSQNFEKSSTEAVENVNKILITTLSPSENFSENIKENVNKISEDFENIKTIVNDNINGTSVDIKSALKETLDTVTEKTAVLKDNIENIKTIVNDEATKTLGNAETILQESLNRNLNEGLLKDNRNTENIKTIVNDEATKTLGNAETILQESLNRNLNEGLLKDNRNTENIKTIVNDETTKTLENAQTILQENLNKNVNLEQSLNEGVKFVKNVENFETALKESLDTVTEESSLLQDNKSIENIKTIVNDEAIKTLGNAKTILQENVENFETALKQSLDTVTEESALSPDNKNIENIKTIVNDEATKTFGNVQTIVQQSLNKIPDLQQSLNEGEKIVENVENFGNKQNLKTIVNDEEDLLSKDAKETSLKTTETNSLLPQSLGILNEQTNLFENMKILENSQNAKTIVNDESTKASSNAELTSQDFTSALEQPQNTLNNVVKLVEAVKQLENSENFKTIVNEEQTQTSTEAEAALKGGNSALKQAVNTLNKAVNIGETMENSEDYTTIVNDEIIKSFGQPKHTKENFNLNSAIKQTISNLNNFNKISEENSSFENSENSKLVVNDEVTETSSEEKSTENNSFVTNLDLKQSLESLNNNNFENSENLKSIVNDEVTKTSAEIESNSEENFDINTVFKPTLDNINEGIQFVKDIGNIENSVNLKSIVNDELNKTSAEEELNSEDESAKNAILKQEADHFNAAIQFLKDVNNNENSQNFKTIVNEDSDSHAQETFNINSAQSLDNLSAEATLTASGNNFDNFKTIVNDEQTEISAEDEANDEDKFGINSALKQSLDNFNGGIKFVKDIVNFENSENSKTIVNDETTEISLKEESKPHHDFGLHTVLKPSLDTFNEGVKFIKEATNLKHFENQKTIVNNEETTTATEKESKLYDNFNLNEGIRIVGDDTSLENNVNLKTIVNDIETKATDEADNLKSALKQSLDMFNGGIKFVESEGVRFSENVQETAEDLNSLQEEAKNIFTENTNAILNFTENQNEYINKFSEDYQNKEIIVNENESKDGEETVSKEGFDIKSILRQSLGTFIEGVTFSENNNNSEQEEDNLKSNEESKVEEISITETPVENVHQIPEVLQNSDNFTDLNSEATQKESSALDQFADIIKEGYRKNLQNSYDDLKPEEEAKIDISLNSQTPVFSLNDSKNKIPEDFQENENITETAIQEGSSQYSIINQFSETIKEGVKYLENISSSEESSADLKPLEKAKVEEVLLTTQTPILSLFNRFKEIPEDFLNSNTKENENITETDLKQEQNLPEDSEFNSALKHITETLIEGEKFLENLSNFQNTTDELKPTEEVKTEEILLTTKTPVLSLLDSFTQIPDQKSISENYTETDLKAEENSSESSDSNEAFNQFANAITNGVKLLENITSYAKSSDNFDPVSDEEERKTTEEMPVTTQTPIVSLFNSFNQRPEDFPNVNFKFEQNPHEQEPVIEVAEDLEKAASELFTTKEVENTENISISTQNPQESSYLNLALSQGVSSFKKAQNNNNFDKALSDLITPKEVNEFEKLSVNEQTKNIAFSGSLNKVTDESTEDINTASSPSANSFEETENDNNFEKALSELIALKDEEESKTDQSTTEAFNENLSKITEESQYFGNNKESTKTDDDESHHEESLNQNSNINITEENVTNNEQVSESDGSSESSTADLNLLKGNMETTGSIQNSNINITEETVTNNEQVSESDGSSESSTADLNLLKENMETSGSIQNSNINITEETVTNNEQVSESDSSSESSTAGLNLLKENIETTGFIKDLIREESITQLQNDSDESLQKEGQADRSSVALENSTADTISLKEEDEIKQNILTTINPIENSNETLSQIEENFQQSRVNGIQKDIESEGQEGLSQFNRSLNSFNVEEKVMEDLNNLEKLVEASITEKVKENLEKTIHTFNSKDSHHNMFDNEEVLIPDNEAVKNLSEILNETLSNVSGNSYTISTDNEKEHIIRPSENNIALNNELPKSSEELSLRSFGNEQVQEDSESLNRPNSSDTVESSEGTQQIFNPNLFEAIQIRQEELLEDLLKEKEHITSTEIPVNQEELSTTLQGFLNENIKEISLDFTTEIPNSSEESLDNLTYKVNSRIIEVPTAKEIDKVFGYLAAMRTFNEMKEDLLTEPTTFADIEETTDSTTSPTTDLSSTTTDLSSTSVRQQETSTNYEENAEDFTTSTSPQETTIIPNNDSKDSMPLAIFEELNQNNAARKDSTGYSKRIFNMENYSQYLIAREDEPKNFETSTQESSFAPTKIEHTEEDSATPSSQQRQFSTTSTSNSEDTTYMPTKFEEELSMAVKNLEATTHHHFEEFQMNLKNAFKSFTKWEAEHQKQEDTTNTMKTPLESLATLKTEETTQETTTVKSIEETTQGTVLETVNKVMEEEQRLKGAINENFVDKFDESVQQNSLEDNNKKEDIETEVTTTMESAQDKEAMITTASDEYEKGHFTTMASTVLTTQTPLQEEVTNFQKQFAQLKEIDTTSAEHMTTIRNEINEELSTLSATQEASTTDTQEKTTETQETTENETETTVVPIFARVPIQKDINSVSLTKFIDDSREEQITKEDFNHNNNAETPNKMETPQLSPENKEEIYYNPIEDNVDKLKMSTNEEMVTQTSPEEFFQEMVTFIEHQQQQESTTHRQEELAQTHLPQTQASFMEEHQQQIESTTEQDSQTHTYANMREENIQETALEKETTTTFTSFNAVTTPSPEAEVDSTIIVQTEIVTASPDISTTTPATIQIEPEARSLALTPPKIEYLQNEDGVEVFYGYSIVKRN